MICTNNFFKVNLLAVILQIPPIKMRYNYLVMRFGRIKDVNKVHILKTQKASHFCEAFEVENNGFEPMTPTLPV